MGLAAMSLLIVRRFIFGIIDILEQWDLRWRVQNAVLSSAYRLVCKNDRVDGISALPPAEYADRFFTFIKQEVLQAWPGYREENNDENISRLQRCLRYLKLSR